MCHGKCLKEVLIVATALKDRKSFLMSPKTYAGIEPDPRESESNEDKGSNGCSKSNTI